MPSCVFTRNQVLRCLSDDAARREAEAIPDFIYFFLRDVFLAVDDDGDGYVTGESVSRLFPALAPVREATCAASSSAAQGLMTPIVHPVWLSPTSYVSPTRCLAAAHQRPLDLASFMQTYWPMVSDRMAHLVGDTWSQRSSDSCGDTISDSPHPCASTGRWPVFSASPFRDVSASPLPPPPTSPLAVSFTDGGSRFLPFSGARLLPGRETVAPEQHDLYHKALQCMWMRGPPLPPHACAPSPESASPPVSLPITPPCPQRLWTDDDMEELLIAFTYLDRNQSGYVGVTDVAAALQALLRTAASTGWNAASAVTPAEMGDEVRQLASEMLRVALSSTTATRSVANAPPPPNTTLCCSSGTPSAFPSVSSSGPCVSCTVFVRSFQCGTGALPAELIAWCAGCARTNCEPPARALSTAAQWMSPVECAYLQQLFISYADLLWAERGNLSCPSSTALEKADPAPTAALSERFSVNTHSKKKTLEHCHSVGNCDDGRHDRYACQTRETVVTLRQYCRRTRVKSQPSVTSDMTTLPLALLETCLRQDVRANLFPEAFVFSTAVAASLETVVEHHVQAVCALAQRTALLPAPSHSPGVVVAGDSLEPYAHGEHRGESAHVDMDTLVGVITADPRCLQLGVLVPLELRLAAVVDAAQQHPRRLVEESMELLSKFVHDARLNECSQLPDVLGLRRALFRVSPILGRLITGATSFCEGRLRLEECLVRLSTHVLSVPPLLRVPLSRGVEDTLVTSAPLTAPDDSLTVLCDHPCYTLLRDSRLLMASYGWLRYACRRMPPRELRNVVDALRSSGGSSDSQGSLFEAAAGWSGAILDVEGTERIQQHTISLPDVYTEVLPRVKASCWVCKVDPVLAAHVALVLVAASVTTDTAGLAEESVWWTRVHSLLGQWIASHSNCCSSQKLTDAWAMNAISCTSAELGLSCCQAVSRELSQLHFTSPNTSHVAVVEEELTRSLTRVITSLSLWAPPPSANLELQSSSAAACARLVDTLVGSCPCLETSLVDVSSLLRRWLEAYHLPMPVTHLSLCCAVEEVESIYYALKRLAASEETQRRRSRSPAKWALAPPSAVGKGSGPATGALESKPASCAPVVTGISPVCLSDLLENEDLLLALYAISPQEAVGVWGGALSHLSSLLRSVLLSPTGVRFALEKLHAEPLSSGDGVAPAVPMPAKNRPLAMAHSHRNGRQSALADTVISMAVPASLQHAVTQLFAQIDAEGSGAVTEDQLRNHRSQVRASVRYGWHRFVTALCSRSAITPSSALAPSPLSAAGFSASVLRSHRWRRRHRAGTAPPCSGSKAQQEKEETSHSSIAALRTNDDDVSMTYSLGDVLIRISELRACVQAQLLEANRARADAEASVFMARKVDFAATRVVTGASSPFSTAASQRTALSSPPMAGTAAWWATYLDELCRSYSPLVL
ncbi:hypothetical protein JKF63_01195 [Porcisia hertigi]|uniref:EF-hand domain-containing protein n=1 Tax=Porcisia hertigi TaxID=2761500 RepID=A0A836HG21_9TRYP|nr:hypothetical protein JKF63_01195 [Porcisia hertigi]